MEERTFGFRTRALHAGTPPDGETGARALPLHLSTAFVFDSTEHAAELFALRTYGNIYTRIGNPTVAAFEEQERMIAGRWKLGDRAGRRNAAEPMPEPFREPQVPVGRRNDPGWA